MKMPVRVMTNPEVLPIYETMSVSVGKNIKDEQRLEMQIQMG